VATVIAHELAHAWFGGLVDMPRPEDRWLVEALTTYVSRAALTELLPGTAAWTASTSPTLPDHGYADDAAAIRRLEPSDRSPGCLRRPAQPAARSPRRQRGHSRPRRILVLGEWAGPAPVGSPDTHPERPRRPLTTTRYPRTSGDQQAWHDQSCLNTRQPSQTRRTPVRCIPNPNRSCRQSLTDVGVACGKVDHCQ
jgi:hypothetical protein